MPHHFIHVEIPCTDFDKAREFYEGVFGWKTSYVPEMDYMLFETGGGLEGGFYKSPEHAGRQGVVNYIEVEDIEKTLEAIHRHGGRTIVPQTCVAESGWFALFGDQDGNVLGLWKEIDKVTS
ncbi:MAG: VOC family protein [candidate division KSB1 bacterium]|nr:VOC family protein [candidate division KSB1 bacterium]MDZ7302161.1 VOC family protein [candidate division KSB1 bacterium]MDZ7311270.1 VOC family protein [candidate division KSB1 bacterium]